MDGGLRPTTSVVRVYFTIGISLLIILSIFIHVEDNFKQIPEARPTFALQSLSEARPTFALQSLSNEKSQFGKITKTRLPKLPMVLRQALKNVNKPQNFLPVYKNPCWYEKLNGSNVQFLCLPYFFLIGTSKSGTSDLCSKLEGHPSIVSSRKETHWVSSGMFKNGNEGPSISPIDGLVNFFKDGAIPEIRNSSSEFGFYNKILGECSATTIWTNAYWIFARNQGRSPRYEPVFTNADFIYFLNPKTKIIAIIRDPIERLYSGYLYFNFGELSQQGFHDYVKQNIINFNSCLRKNPLRGCVYPPAAKRYSLRIRLGIYAVQLQDYLRVFPRDQVAVVRVEDFTTDIPAYLNQLYSFLDLDTLSDDFIQNIAGKRRMNERKPKNKTVGDMLPETRELLKKFYEPYNEALGELLGDKYNYNQYYR